MRRRAGWLSVVFVVAVIGGLKVAQELYRFYAFEDERLEIVRLEREVEAEGLGVIGSQLRADTLRGEIDLADATLQVARRDIERIEGYMRAGTMSEGGAYRRDLLDYNTLVARRNSLFREWRQTVDQNHAHVDRYNMLVDSIRKLATRMGDPYYPILTPAEIVARREAAADGR